jgi:hypothetical protein
MAGDAPNAPAAADHSKEAINMNQTTGPLLSPDGLWRWDGYRWVPSSQPPPPSVGRRHNYLLIFAVLAATSIIWLPPIAFFFIWASTYFMQGWNGR